MEKGGTPDYECDCCQWKGKRIALWKKAEHPERLYCPECKMDFFPTCRKCGGDCKWGKAIPTAIQTSEEGTMSEAAWAGHAPLESCWKCEQCGHSFILANEKSSYPKD